MKARTVMAECNIMGALHLLANLRGYCDALCVTHPLIAVHLLEQIGQTEHALQCALGNLLGAPSDMDSIHGAISGRLLEAFCALARTEGQPTTDYDEADAAAGGAA
jgi:hypothetical protein